MSAASLSSNRHRIEAVPQEDREEADGILRNDVAVLGEEEPRVTSSSKSPLWWIVRLLVAVAVLLLINTAVWTIDASGNSINYSTEPTVRISAKLNNATLPNWKPLPKESQTLSRIAFGSCSAQEMPLPYWDIITMMDTDLFLLMGDNVYGNCNESSCQTLREAYRKLSIHPSLVGASPRLSVFPTLDDHDYGQNNCHADNPYKHLAIGLFQEFFHVTDLPNDGVYRSRVWGRENERLQVILLDTRYNRSPFVGTGDPSAPFVPASSDDASQQMLGEDQWLFLQQQLQIPADLRLVVSSIQVLNNGTGFEAWRHLPAERQRLVDLLQSKNVLMFSGDRHVGGIYEFESLVEVTASSFTHTMPLGAFDNCTVDCDEVDAARVSDLVRDNHFGYLEIDWQTRSLQVSLRRSESSYGSTYLKHYDGQKSDAGEIIVEKRYNFEDL